MPRKRTVFKVDMNGCSKYPGMFGFTRFDPETKVFTKHPGGYFLQGCKAYLQDTIIHCHVLIKDKKEKRAFFYRGMAPVVVTIKPDKLPLVETVMRHAEEQLGVKVKTRWNPTNEEGVYIARISSYWYSSLVMISLWSLLVRITMAGYHGDVSAERFLDNYVGDHWYANWSTSNGWAKEKYKHFIKHGTEAVPPLTAHIHNPHAAGILTYKYK